MASLAAADGKFFAALQTAFLHSNSAGEMLARVECLRYGPL